MIQRPPDEMAEKLTAAAAELQRGIDRHRSGDWVVAADHYKATLALDPGNADALHLLGLIAYQLGNFTDAVTLIGHAIDLQPATAVFHCGLGKALAGSARYDDSLRSLGRAIELDPNLLDAHLNQAVVLDAAGRLTEAIDRYAYLLKRLPGDPDVSLYLAGALQRLGQHEEALQVIQVTLQHRPDDAEAHWVSANALTALNRLDAALVEYDQAVNCQFPKPASYAGRAVVHQRLGHHQQALADCDQALALAPQWLEVYLNRAAALMALGRYPDALESYDAAIAINPTFADAYAGRGAALEKMDRLADALLSCDQAIALRPDDAQAHMHRGNVLQRLERFEETLASCQLAVTLNPGSAQAYSNLGTAQQALGRDAEALASYETALALSPNDARIHSNWGSVQQQLGRLNEALLGYDRALQLDPACADAAFNKSLLLLLMGDFAAGLPLYEWRWLSVDLIRVRRHFTQPAWCGEDLRNRTLLVYAEQGFGDTILCARYLPVLALAGARVLFELPRPLHKLFQGFPGVAQLLAPGELLPAFDCQCALMSLPLLMGTRVETIPGEIPYLRADSTLAAAWRAQLPAKGLRVGIHWQGRRSRVDLGRSFPVALFAEIAKIPSVELISLQKGYGVEQLQDLPHGMRVQNLGADFDAGPDAFLDTAAVIANLDLVITSDTAMAHLAGALGSKVWVPLKATPAWIWGLKDAHSAWYPTMRLYRATVNGDWGAVFSQMHDDLSTLVAG